MASVPVSCGGCLVATTTDVSFDWFFKSRTPDELKRRGQTLLLCIMKNKPEADDADFKAPKGVKVSCSPV